jgi:hypothetical protein
VTTCSVQCVYVVCTPFGLALFVYYVFLYVCFHRTVSANINSAFAGIDPSIARRVMDRPSIPVGESLFRLQAAAAATAGGLGNPAMASHGELSHTHTHSHTHLHLHQPDPSQATPSNAFQPLHPILNAAASPFGPPPNAAFSLPPG